MFVKEQERVYQSLECGIRGCVWIRSILKPMHSFLTRLISVTKTLVWHSVCLVFLISVWDPGKGAPGQFLFGLVFELHVDMTWTRGISCRRVCFVHVMLGRNSPLGLPGCPNSRILNWTPSVGESLQLRVIWKGSDPALCLLFRTGLFLASSLHLCSHCLVFKLWA